MTNLWSENTPQKFWQCWPEMPDETWNIAIRKAAPILGLLKGIDSIDDILASTLGEGQFGRNRYKLSPARRFYYIVKPLASSRIRLWLRKMHAESARNSYILGWPVETRFVRFLREVLRQVMLLNNAPSLFYRHLWPGGKRFALVLSHDIESMEGQDWAGQLMDAEEALGLRSAFFFIPERYPVDYGLMNEMRKRGFEVGLHGLNHDGKLFASRKLFVKRVNKINSYMRNWEMIGFSSPLSHRNPQWMQEIEMQYSISHFDTDPFEPMPGGVMGLWPFIVGKYIELPYTLVQDCTLINILGQTTPTLWQDKLLFIRYHHGMAHLKTHPDYLRERGNLSIYTSFLRFALEHQDCWCALPCEAAEWWRKRSNHSMFTNNETHGLAVLEGEKVSLEKITDQRIISRP